MTYGEVLRAIILFDPEFRRMVRVYDLLRYRSIYLDK